MQSQKVSFANGFANKNFNKRRPLMLRYDNTKYDD